MGDKVELITPRTKKTLFANTKDLREINKNIAVNAKNRVRKKYELITNT